MFIACWDVLTWTKEVVEAQGVLGQTLQNLKTLLHKHQKCIFI
jgi:hypothetical protein